MNPPFTLVSWNLFQGLHHTSKRGAWVQNDGVEKHLERLDADVLVLPEAWTHRRPRATWAEELADRLGYELHQWVTDRPGRRKDRAPFRMVILTRIPARRLDDVLLPEFKGFGPRAIVRIELVDTALQIAGAHAYGIHLLMARRPKEWLQERRAIRDVLSGVDVLAGDLNMWGPVVRRDARDHRSAVKGRTFPSARPHSQIDHVLVGEQVEVLSGEVMPDMGSDHRALRTVLARTDRQR